MWSNQTGQHTVVKVVSGFTLVPFYTFILFIFSFQSLTSALSLSLSYWPHADLLADEKVKARVCVRLTCVWDVGYR